MTNAVLLGVDLGGTKTEIIALDASGEKLLRARRATPADDYMAILDTITAMVAETERQLGARGTVGIGTPGALSPASGLLRNANTVCLNGKPLKTDLEARLGRPIRLANDANCFALSEASDGAAAGASVVFGVIIGTGAGAGIVVNGRVLNGRNAIAGEWGHNPLPWPNDDERPGPDCYCGRHGCIETWLSGPGMRRDHKNIASESLEPARIVRGATRDAARAATLDRYIDRLSRALAHVINLLDPDVIVLGGGMGNIDALYEQVPERWRQWVFSDVVATRLARPTHGDSSGVRGAAWLWKA